MYVVVDIEATCSVDAAINASNQKVIEIGAVVVSKDGHVGGEFSRFVNPGEKLTEFCTALTTITQEQVNEAEPFDVVWRWFYAWLQSESAFAFASWGMFDWNLLNSECARHQLVFPFQQFVNLPRLTRDELGTGSQRIAYRKLGITPDGPRHRAIVDARNYAKILSALVNR